MNRNILLILTEKIFNNNIDFFRLDEQLQISMQILINKGYKILTIGDGEKSFEYSEKFAYIFKDKNMKNIENIIDNYEKENLIKNTDIIICFDKEDVELAKVLKKAFIFIDCYEKNVDEQERKSMNFEVFSLEELNAGEIVRRTEKLSYKEVEETNLLKNNRENNSSDEFELYKKQVKKTIEEFINNNRLEEAKSIIKEYESIVKDDVDIYSMKSIVFIMEGNLDKAEEALKNGLNLNKNHFDLLYNLAYTYQLKKKYYEAKKYYIKSKELAKDDKMICKLDSLLSEIEVLYKNDSYCKLIIEKTENKEALPPLEDIYTSRKMYSKLLLEDKDPTVSIFVLAYNNLETYTKPCIESILKYTIDIDYELVLVDNGSSDNTFEYFKSIQHHKKKIVRITENKGPIYGGLIGMDCMKSQYIVCIPNDVFVTKNWLANMIKCAESDEKIGFIVPASDNISNLQSVNLGFDSFDEMQTKAELYNTSDPRKWEERLRLINAVTFFRKECLDIIGKMDYGFFHDFGDDDLTFRVRRAGYKAIFCNDVFVHHAGCTATGGDPAAKIEILKKGREIFKQKYFGVDSWDDAGNYELTMLSLIEPNENRGIAEPKILGIDVRCGTPILQIKNKLRLADIFDAKLAAFVQDPKYWIDLKTICEGEIKVDRIEFLSEHFENEKFDYILLGESLNTYKNPYKLISDMLNILKKDGSLLLKIRNNYDIRIFLNILGKNVDTDQEITSSFNIDILNKYLKEKGYIFKNVTADTYSIDQNTKNYIMDILKKSQTKVDMNNIYNKMIVRDYVVNIIKEVQHIKKGDE